MATAPQDSNSQQYLPPGVTSMMTPEGSSRQACVKVVTDHFRHVLTVAELHPEQLDDDGQLRGDVLAQLDVFVPLDTLSEGGVNGKIETRLGFRCKPAGTEQGHEPFDLYYVSWGGTLTYRLSSTEAAADGDQEMTFVVGGDDQGGQLLLVCGEVCLDILQLLATPDGATPEETIPAVIAGYVTYVRRYMGVLLSLNRHFTLSARTVQDDAQEPEA